MGYPCSFNAVSDPNKLGDWVAESAFMLPAIILLMNLRYEY